MQASRKGRVSMIKIEMTKDEFQMLTEWSRDHFWDNTESFTDDIDIDELLRWSRSCLLMARLKSIADENDIYFGLDSQYCEDAEDSTKLKVVTAFVEQYSNNITNIKDVLKGAAASKKVED